MFRSKPIQILDPKYEGDCLYIFFTKIGSRKLFTDLLVLTLKKHDISYNYVSYDETYPFLFIRVHLVRILRNISG